MRETIGLSGALDVIGMKMPEASGFSKRAADKIDDGTSSRFNILVMYVAGMVCYLHIPKNTHNLTKHHTHTHTHRITQRQ